MKQVPMLAAAAFLGLSAASFTATTASAAVVCNRDGDCWHVQHPPAYRPAYGLAVHPDNWRWGKHDHYRWREHAGRGYWQHGRWMTF